MARTKQPILMAIGGAIPIDSSQILREFLRRAGGAQARIVVIPTASSQAETGTIFSQAFQEQGAKQTPFVLNVRERVEAFDPAYSQPLRESSGVFITGGNQMRLSAILGGSPVEQELQAAYRRGAVIGGTSAGAAVLSSIMLASGRNGSTPRWGMAQIAPGFGLTDQVIFDQHFRQRDRLGRLLYAISIHPGVLGVGVDENTAAILRGPILTVFGQNAVTILDGTNMQASGATEVARGRPVTISGVQVHVLTHGCTFHIKQRKATIPNSNTAGPQ